MLHVNPVSQFVSANTDYIKAFSITSVMIVGVTDKDRVGKTAISGPLTNIVICIGFFALTLLVPQENPFFIVGLFAAAFNAFIAALNLLPFGMFDGWKVFQWSRLVWVLVFIPSVILTIGTFTFYSNYA